MGDQLLADFCAVRTSVQRGVVASSRKKLHSHWAIWARFYGTLGLPSDLEGVRDPIPLLQIFGHRVRTGEYAIHSAKLRKRLVEQYLRSVGQAFASMGAHDIRLDARRKTDFRLGRQLRSYMREDSPPTRVKPIPLLVIMDTCKRLQRGSTKDRFIADLILMGFHYLLRPGEYCASGIDSESTPFRMQDATIYKNQRRLTLPCRRVPNRS